MYPIWLLDHSQVSRNTERTRLAFANSVVSLLSTVLIIIGPSASIGGPGKRNSICWCLKQFIPAPELLSLAQLHFYIVSYLNASCLHKQLGCYSSLKMHSWNRSTFQIGWSVFSNSNLKVTPAGETWVVGLSGSNTDPMFHRWHEQLSRHQWQPTVNNACLSVI